MLTSRIAGVIEGSPALSSRLDLTIFPMCGCPFRRNNGFRAKHNMSNTLAELSNQLTVAVERASASVVAVYGRPRVPSSGVVWRPGLVVTADAALRRDEDLEVTLPSGETVTATLKGRDPSTDLALLALDTSATTPAVFTNDSAKIGRIIVTVGRTRDTGPIACMGIISGVSGEWPTWRGGKLDEFVRLDTALYATSAGGAVADTDGAILGIVSAGLSRTSVIAVTRRTIERVGEILLATGRVSRGYLGVGVQPVALPANLARTLGIEQESGIMAINVEESSPGASAGLLIGDVILSIGDRIVTGPEALNAALGPESVGRAYPLRIMRGGAVQQLSVTVGERPRRGA
jgi:S1-C subfamily serine protease